MKSYIYKSYILPDTLFFLNHETSLSADPRLTNILLELIKILGVRRETREDRRDLRLMTSFSVSSSEVRMYKFPFMSLFIEYLDKAYENGRKNLLEQLKGAQNRLYTSNKYKIHHLILCLYQG